MVGRHVAPLRHGTAAHVLASDSQKVPVKLAEHTQS